MRHTAAPPWTAPSHPPSSPSLASGHPPVSLFSPSSAKGKGRALDMPSSTLDADDRRARRRSRTRPAPPQPPADVNPNAEGRTLAADAKPRSLSRRRYRLPSPPVDSDAYCCCCDGDAEAQIGRGTAGRLSAPTARSTFRVTDPARTASTVSSEDDEEDLSSATSSVSSLVPALSPSSSRSKLFESDDEDDGADDACTLSTTDYSSRSFSPVTPTSFGSLLQRKSSISKAATSDPLLSPSSSPTFSYGASRRRGHWLPSPAAPTSSEVAVELELPDIVQTTIPASPPVSPPRSSPASSPSRPSLLTKSLRTLSRLPNLTLPDLLPRLPGADAYLASSPPSPSFTQGADLSHLPPGWGPAERRRVLAAEPSHAADEARGYRLTLSRSRRQPSPPPADFPAAPVAAHTVVDEVEASAVALEPAHSLRGLRAGGSGDEKGGATSEALGGDARSPTSPTADIPPLTPAPVLQDPFLPAQVPGPPDAALAADADADTLLASPPAPALLPRYISNHRHLLMLAVEFEMMRHAKIRGPLRQRAVIVRQATSPPRLRDGLEKERERSKLCEEVVVV
ncbi:hypothetical protein Rhopal_002772-T1 [Rhodotorula paludigena]|uniref:Proteophosphoglycan ppg4 n=1 Tax=Rhodotorula paludigena TaxID=86838 RepID=A0AAV5GM85_9BASI|nr:hypothetical protein Rhopal_002772-T1 [Rhodotorula paludigena]